MSYRILVVNPGSTSTKIGVYEDENLLFDKTLRHSAEDIAQFKTIAAQKDWRRDLVMRALREQGIDKLADVKIARMEPDGAISVIRSHEPQGPAGGASKRAARRAAISATLRAPSTSARIAWPMSSSRIARSGASSAQVPRTRSQCSRTPRGRTGRSPAPIIPPPSRSAWAIA